MSDEDEDKAVSFDDLKSVSPNLDPERADEIAADGPEWMTPMDVKILHLLHLTPPTSPSGLVMSPDIIAENIGHSRTSVSRRLNALQASGIVEKVDRGKYRISDKGWNFLYDEF